MNHTELVEYYIDDLRSHVSFNGGVTYQQKVKHIGNWARLQETISPVTMIPTDTDLWVWSDLHFYHKNVINYSKSPFINDIVMNTTLVNNFNSVVGKDDISLWIGDIGFGSDKDINYLLDQCNGYKLLVVGNHDLNKGKLRHLNFNEIHLVYNIQYLGQDLMCSHYPVEAVPDNYINVHGHIHANNSDVSYHKELSDKHRNVNCEFHNYTPIRLSSIII